MIKKINLKRKDGKIIQGILKKLDESYINRIMRFQDEIVEGLENKELYFPSKEEEFLQFISNKGNIIGCVTEDDDLIAIGVYCKLGYDEDNYGCDIGINGEELLKVGRGKEIKEIFTFHNIQTKIIAASIRNPIHVIESARGGADIGTVPPSVIKQLIKHPLTDIGIKKFEEDWKSIK